MSNEDLRAINAELREAIHALDSYALLRALERLDAALIQAERGVSR